MFSVYTSHRTLLMIRTFKRQSRNRNGSWILQSPQRCGRYWHRWSKMELPHDCATHSSTVEGRPLPWEENPAQETTGSRPSAAVGDYGRLEPSVAPEHLCFIWEIVTSAFSRRTLPATKQIGIHLRVPCRLQFSNSSHRSSNPRATFRETQRIYRLRRIISPITSSRCRPRHVFLAASAATSFNPWLQGLSE